MIFSGRASDSQLRLARHLVVFTTAVVCFGPAVPSSVAQTTGAIRGIVRNSEGQAVGAARVVVNRLGPGDAGVEIETEADGRFAHDGLESGFYTVAADKDGLGSESYRVRVRGGRTVAVNFLVESGRRVTSGLVDLFGAGVAARRTGTYSEVYRVRVRGGRTVEINFLVEPGQRVASGSVDPGKREALAAAFGAGVAASRAGAYGGSGRAVCAGARAAFDLCRVPLQRRRGLLRDRPIYRCRSSVQACNRPPTGLHRRLLRVGERVPPSKPPRGCRRRA